jgi:hypothetical protein
MKKLILIVAAAMFVFSAQAQWNTIYPNSGANAGVSLSNAVSQLQIGMVSCDGCYASQAKIGDAVFRNLGQGSLFFNIPTNTPTDSRKIVFAADYGRLMQISADGKVSIGTVTTPGSSTDYRLYVQSGILTEKVKVALKTTSDWADYVFDKHYKLMPLNQLEQFLNQNKHLPNFPSAEEVVKNGIDVAKMDAKLLEKIEELTLYLIQLNKKVEALSKETEALKARLADQ